MRYISRLLLLLVLASWAACLEPTRGGESIEPREYCPQNNELRCNGSVVELCVDNGWTPSLPCPEAYACQDAACVCGDPCGDKQCGFDGCGRPCGTCDDDQACTNAGTCVVIGGCVPNCANRSCGSDDCGGSCGTCPDDLACVSDDTSASCGASITCGDVLSCLVDCVITGEQTSTLADCQEGCLAGASVTVTGEADVVIACVVTKTEEVQCEPLDCIADYCSVPFASCFYAIQGPLSCGDIWNCTKNCADGDLGCETECAEQGTSEAQADFVSLNFCLRSACGGALFDNACEAASTTSVGPCKDAYDTCLGG